MKSFKKYLSLLIAVLFVLPAYSYNKQNLLGAVNSNSVSQVKKIIAASSHLVDLKYNKENDTILMVALQNKCNSKIIDALLDGGCSPDLKNKQGQTALMFACSSGYDEKIIKQITNYGLLVKGLKTKRVLTKDKDGKTAFDYCEKGSKPYNALLQFANDPAYAAEIAESRPKPIEKQKKVKDTVEKTEVEVPVEETVEEVEVTEDPAEETEVALIEEEELSEPPVTVAEEISEEVAEEVEEEISVETVEVTEVIEEEISAEAVEVTEVVETEEATEEVIETVEASAVTEEPQIEKTAEPVEVVIEEKKEVATKEISQPKTEEKLPEITSFVNVPKIDYYNKNRPEYLFDEIESDPTDVSEMFVDNKVQVIKNPDTLDKSGRTRLMNAIMSNDLKACYDLLYSGADINARDKNGWTPLMFACRYAKVPEIVELLFKYGAKVDDRNKFNVSVLQITAAFCESKEILTIVLSNAKASNIEISGSFITALKQERDVEIIKQFLKFVPNLNTSYKGKTPLMYAAESYESTDVIKLLLESGADPYIISIEKKNAFGYAKENPKIIRDSIFWSLNVSSSKRR